VYMKFLTILFSWKTHKKAIKKTMKEYQEDVFKKQSREQFKKLLQLGSVPVAFL